MLESFSGCEDPTLQLIAVQNEGVVDSLMNCEKGM